MQLPPLDMLKMLTEDPQRLSKKLALAMALERRPYLVARPKHRSEPTEPHAPAKDDDGLHRKV